MNTKTQQELLMKPQFSEQQFFKDMVKFLKGQFFQSGAIESMNPARLKVKYVWGYQYTGTVDGTWSGQLQGDHTITFGNKKVELKAGTPVSDRFRTLTFDIVVPCLPKDDEHLEVPAGLFFPLEDINLIPYDERVNVPTENITGDLSASPAEYWQTCCNEVTDHIGLKHAKTLGSSIGYILGTLGKVTPEEAAQLIAMGNQFDTQHLCNLEVMTRSTLETYGNKVLIPYYVLDYEFKGENYFLQEFADGSGISHCRVPLRKVQDPAEQVAAEMPDKVKQANLLKWGWALAVIVFFLFNFISALVVLALWGGVYWYISKPIRDRKIEIERTRNQNEEINMQKMKAQWGI